MPSSCNFIMIRKKSGEYFSTRISYIEGKRSNQNQQNHWIVPTSGDVQGLSKIAIFPIWAMQYYVFLPMTSIGEKNQISLIILVENLGGKGDDHSRIWHRLSVVMSKIIWHEVINKMRSKIESNLKTIASRLELRKFQLKSHSRLKIWILIKFNEPSLKKWFKMNRQPHRIEPSNFPKRT